MHADTSHAEILYLLRRCGVGMASVETPRGSVNGSAVMKGDRVHVTVYTLEDPTVSLGERYRRVMERWADTPEEAARILRRGVLWHAETRAALHEAQRRIYAAESAVG
jgi:hypothetical protein